MEEIHTSLVLTANGLGLSVFDIVLGILLALGLIRGFIKGFIIEIASLIALIAGIYGATHFSYYLVDLLLQYLSWDPQYINITALVLTFIIIVVAISLVAKIFTKLAKLMALNMVNRLLGGLFGLLKVGFVLGILLMYFDNFNQTAHFIDQKELQKSVLYAPVKKFSATILPSVLTEIEKHSDWSPQIDSSDTTPPKLLP